MSDSVTKWHEMQEENKYQTATSAGTFIYESPDGGQTVTRRPFGSDIDEREIIQQPEREVQEIKKQAYRLLCDYDEDVIRMAVKILDLEK